MVTWRSVMAPPSNQQTDPRPSLRKSPFNAAILHETMSDGAKVIYRFFPSKVPTDDSFAALLIHGWRLTGEIFIPTVFHLTRKVNVIVPELRCNPGGSTRGATTPKKYFPATATDMVTIAKKHGISHVMALGHSLGGGVVHELLTQNPDFVDAIVLSNAIYTNPLVSWALGNSLPVRMAVRALIAVAEHHPLTGPIKDNVIARIELLEHVARIALDAAGVLDSDNIAHEIFSDVYQHALDGTISDFLLPLHAMLELNRDFAELSSLKTPALVIAGRRDRLVRFDYSEEMAKAIPNASFLALDGAHVSPLECRHEFGKAVLDFAAPYAR